MSAPGSRRRSAPARSKPWSNTGQARSARGRRGHSVVLKRQQQRRGVSFRPRCNPFPGPPPVALGVRGGPRGRPWERGSTIWPKAVGFWSNTGRGRTLGRGPPGPVPSEQPPPAGVERSFDHFDHDPSGRILVKYGSGGVGGGDRTPAVRCLECVRAHTRRPGMLPKAVRCSPTPRERTRAHTRADTPAGDAHHRRG
jgi:hypothetical protein